MLDENSPDNPTISDLMGSVVSSLESLGQIDPSRLTLSITASQIFEDITELNSQLRDYQEQIEFNPNRLSQVEERIALIGNLKRKYGDTIEAVLAFGAKAKSEFETIANAGERILELESEQDKKLLLLSQQGLALSEKRHTAALDLQTALELELDDLKMEEARFQVDFQQRTDPEGVPSPMDSAWLLMLMDLNISSLLLKQTPAKVSNPWSKLHLEVKHHVSCWR